MRLETRAAPIYLPEADQDTVLRLALRPLGPEEWLIVDDDLPRFREHKLAVVRRFGTSVQATLPGSEAAQEELCELVMADLVRHHGDRFTRHNDALHYLPSEQTWPITSRDIGQASQLVAEDLVVMERIGERYVLTAASVCSPSNWRLEDKIGRTLDEIHGPVPGYQAALSSRVNRLFDRMKPGKPVLRFNWSVQLGDELLLRPDLIPDADNGDGCYWRVERQTLRRLPESGAIVFTIRIFLHSFAALSRGTTFRHDLAAILSRLPEEIKDYKGLRELVDDLN